MFHVYPSSGGQCCLVSRPNFGIVDRSYYSPLSKTNLGQPLSHSLARVSCRGAWAKWTAGAALIESTTSSLVLGTGPTLTGNRLRMSSTHDM